MSDFHYGGQAVLEGVMMRGQGHMAVAVRAPDGQIVTDEQKLDSGIYATRWAKLPFARGLVMLWDTLSLGYRALMFSANVALPEGEGELTGGTMIGTVLISLAFVVGVFFLLPMFLAGWLGSHINSAPLTNLLEGLIRLALFVGYLAAIGLMPDIRRMFAYHGAEHKTVNAYEAGVPLDVQQVSRFSTAHTRCGTGFLLVVMILYIFLTVLIGKPPILWRLASRLVLIPIVAGISYEWLKYSAKHYANRIVRALVTPSLALQRLSTREPDEGMVEVAITALKKVLVADGATAASETEG